MTDSPMVEGDALGPVARGLAHEYNNLLGVAIGNLQLATGAVAEDGDRVEIDRWVQRALEAAERAAELTRSLSMVAPREPREPRKLRVHTLLAELEPVMRAVLGSRVRLEQALCPGDPEVTADPAALAATILRLLIAARGASPDANSLVLRTERRVLAPGDAERSHTQQLYRCLVVSVGDDASASVVLPCLDLGEEARALPQGMTPMPTPGARVLVFDPARSARETAIPWLDHLGYDVSAVVTVEEALALLRREPPDALLVDVDSQGSEECLQLAWSARALAPGTAVGLLSVREDAPPRFGDVILPVLRKPYRQADVAGFLRGLLSADSRSRG